MVFSSVPLYLDPPNWQQQHLSGVNQGNENLHLIHPTSVPNPPPTHMGGGGPGSSPQIRPNSMAERARLAKIPPPEAPLKCPRCDSTNTKFCYFNNYNLSQPRHFCKTCRRYWTRGGALRNVPVGGGCRRNKRSSSKTTSSGGGTPSSTSAKPSATGIGGGMDVGGPTGLVPGIGNAGMTSFMASLQNMAQLGMGNLGLTFGGALQAPPLGGGGDHHHHPQLDFNVSSLLNQHHHAPQMHFPGALSGAFELPTAPAQSGAGGNPNLYSSTSSYQNDVVGNDSNLPKSTTSLSQLAPIKMEGERQVQGQAQGLNLDKQLMMGINNNSSSSTSITDNNNQFWGSGMVGNGTIGTSTNMWTDLSGLNSSSTSHLM